MKLLKEVSKLTGKDFSIEIYSDYSNTIKYIGSEEDDFSINCVNLKETVFELNDIKNKGLFLKNMENITKQ